MILKFRAKAGHLVTCPLSVRRVGQQLRRVGRTYDPEARAYVASKEAYEIDAESKGGRRLVRLFQKERSLWPADEATAEHCGVPFVELSLVDGEWQPATLKEVG